METNTKTFLFMGFVIFAVVLIGLVSATESYETKGGVKAHFQSACGNGICNPFENYTTCPSDCEPNTCGNHICDNIVISEGSCEGYGSLPVYEHENNITCPQDCALLGVCGDGACDSNESISTCCSDCVYQYPGYSCGTGEGCDTLTNTITALYPICGEEVAYSRCDIELEENCYCPICEGQESCIPDPYCGDYSCNGDENADTCMYDCYNEAITTSIYFTPDNNSTKDINESFGIDINSTILRNDLLQDLTINNFMLIDSSGECYVDGNAVGIYSYLISYEPAIQMIEIDENNYYYHFDNVYCTSAFTANIYIDIRDANYLLNEYVSTRGLIIQ